MPASSIWASFAPPSPPSRRASRFGSLQSALLVQAIPFGRTAPARIRTVGIRPPLCPIHRHAAENNGVLPNFRANPRSSPCGSTTQLLKKSLNSLMFSSRHALASWLSCPGAGWRGQRVHIYRAQHSGCFLLPPLRPLRSLLAGPAPAFLRLRSPLERGLSFARESGAVPQKCMAGMLRSVLSIKLVGFIYPLVAEARSDLLLPSDPVSQHRAADLLLLPRSNAHGRAHILLPCSLPHFRSGSSRSDRPYLRIGPFFSPRRQHPAIVVRLSLCAAHGWHDEPAIADQTVKTYIGLVDATPLRFLLPRTRVARHRADTVSSSLGRSPSAPALSSSLRSSHYFRFGFGPIIRLQLRLEPLFLPMPALSPAAAPRFCMAALPIERL